MRIDQADLVRSLRTADPNIIALMERHSENLLANLPRENALIELVRRAITSCLHEEEPSIDIIAPRIERTTRTLQRELSAAGNVQRKHQTRRDQGPDERARYVRLSATVHCEWSS